MCFSFHLSAGTAWTLDDDEELLTPPPPDMDGRRSPTPIVPQLYYTTPPHSVCTTAHLTHLTSPHTNQMHLIRSAVLDDR